MAEAAATHIPGPVASPPTAQCSSDDFALTPANTCLGCGADCTECVLAGPGRARCNRCFSLSSINGVCGRCDDPRCAECPSNASVCQACRNERHVVNKATGRCEDPAWPRPRQQPSEGASHRGGNAGNPAAKPTNVGSGR